MESFYQKPLWTYHFLPCSRRLLCPIAPKSSTWFAVRFTNASGDLRPGLRSRQIRWW